MNSNCPKCEAVLQHAIVNGISLRVPHGQTWEGLAYVCPQCSTILGVQMDPVALKTDTVNEIVALLRRG